MFDGNDIFTYNDWFIFMVNLDEFPPNISGTWQASCPETSWEREKPNGASQGRRQWAIVMTQLDSLLLMLQKSLPNQLRLVVYPWTFPFIT